MENNAIVFEEQAVVDNVALAREARLSPCDALNLEFTSEVTPAGMVASAQKAAVTERLGFLVGDWALLCPVVMGREVIPVPTVSKIPNTAPWLLGMANVRGAILPAIDLAVAFGDAGRTVAGRYLLVLSDGEDMAGLVIDGLPKLNTFEAGSQLKSLPAHPEILGGHVLAAYRHGDAVWLDVDVAGFLVALGSRAGQ